MKGLNMKHRNWITLMAAAAAAAATVALVAGGGSAGAQTATTTTTTAQPPTTTVCAVTSTVSKPTGLTAQVNPNTYLDGTPTALPGILLAWDSPPSHEQVFGYNVYRRVQGESTTLRLIGNVSGLFATDKQDVMDVADVPFAGNLVVGKTYIYRVAAERWDNCGDYQESAQSDPVSVTYTAPPDDFTGGL